MRKGTLKLTVYDETQFNNNNNNRIATRQQAIGGCLACHRPCRAVVEGLGSYNNYHHPGGGRDQTKIEMPFQNYDAAVGLSMDGGRGDKSDSLFPSDSFNSPIYYVNTSRTLQQQEQV